MTHSLAMLNYYTQVKQDMIKNVNTTKVEFNCSNVFYCQNGDNCTQVSLCRKNDTCSLIEKCDAKRGRCSKQQVCQHGGASIVQNITSLDQNDPNSLAGTVKGGKKQKEQIVARNRLAQLREHLDVTAMFLGQQNVGKIIAKLEMDASEKPVGQKEMPKLFDRCQKEVDDALKKMQDSQTKEQKESDKQDQNEKNYS